MVVAVAIGTLNPVSEVRLLPGPLSDRQFAGKTLSFISPGAGITHFLGPVSVVLIGVRCHRPFEWPFEPTLHLLTQSEAVSVEAQPTSKPGFGLVALS